MAKRSPKRTQRAKKGPAWVRGQVEEGKIVPVYLLFGPEGFEREEIVDLIINAVLNETTKAFNLDILNGSEMEVADAINRVLAFPLMAERRVVIIKRVEEIPEAAARAFIPVLANPVDSTVLIFTADKIDSRRKFISELEKAAVSVEFKLPYENEVPAWIKRYAKRIGKTVEPDAADLLSLSIGPRPREIANELEKLDLHTSDKASISADDVMWIVGSSRDVSVFKFVEAVGMRDGRRALQILRRLSEQGYHPAGTLAMLIRHVGILRKARWLLDSGVPRNQYASRLKVAPFFVDKYARQAERFSDDTLWAAYDALLHADDRLKSRSRTFEVTLSRTVLDLCGNLPR